MADAPDIRLISTDFDGTIHEDFAHAPVPEALIELLGGLRARGTAWVINTGRDLSSLMESLGRARVGLLPDYVITVEREIHQHLRGHYQALEPWHSKCAADHAHAFARLAAPLAELNAALEARYDATFYDDPWSPLCVIARTNEQMDAIEIELDAFCTRHTTLGVMRNDVYLRICHRSYSKGTALQEVQRLLGVTPAQTFAAGDHLNDIPMLDTSVAGWLAAPANAIPKIRELVTARGGYVASQKAGHGVLEALRRLTA